MWRFGFSPVTLASHSGFIDQGFCKCRLSTSRNATQNCYTDVQHFPFRNNIRKKLKCALCMLILIEHVECCIYVGDDWIMVISIIPVFNKLSIHFFHSSCPVHLYFLSNNAIFLLSTFNSLHWHSLIASKHWRKPIHGRSHCDLWPCHLQQI